MVGKRIKQNDFCATICIILLLDQVVLSQNSSPIPADKSKVNSWFDSIIKPAKERRDTLDPELITAETQPKVIKVSKHGGGHFNTVTEAIKSVPSGNTKRVIIHIGPGIYIEKIEIDRNKPFITLLGDAKNRPTLTFNGTAKKYGTVDSATLMALANHFVAANLIIQNGSPRPDGKMVGAQAVALRVSGDRSAFYNCKIIGFQDTLCDDRGNHFFKDCCIHGTVDFVFGSGKSLYLSTELFVEGEPGLTVITAQARESSSENNGYAFVHARVTGTGRNAFLGRAWKSSPRVVYAYTEMDTVVNPAGWSSNMQPERAKTVFYGEYKCTGKGATPGSREPFAKQLTDEQAHPFLLLDFIDGIKWLLPPPKV